MSIIDKAIISRCIEEGSDAVGHFVDTDLTKFSPDHVEPLVPYTHDYSLELLAWLNGFNAGMLGLACGKIEQLQKKLDALHRRLTP